MSGDTSPKSSIVVASERALARTSSALAQRGLALVEYLASPEIVLTTNLCVITPDNVGELRVLRYIFALREVPHWTMGEPVPQVRFSPDGKQLAVASPRHGLVFDMEDPILDTDFDYRDSPDLCALFKPVPRSYIQTIAFAPGCRLLAVADNSGTVRVWDCERDDGCVSECSIAQDHFLLDMAFIDDETLVVALTHKRLQWWHVGDELGGWEQLRVLELAGSGDRAGGDTSSMTLSPDGEVVAACFEDDTVHLWRTRDGQRLTSLGPLGPDHEDLDFTASMTFSPDSQQFALRTKEGRVLVLNISESFREWRELTSAGNVRRLGPGDRSLGFVKCVAFSPGGPMLLMSGHGIMAWSPQDGQVLCVLDADFDLDLPESLAFSPDGRVLACSSTHITPITPLYAPDSESVARIRRAESASGAYSQDLWKWTVGVTLWGVPRQMTLPGLPRPVHDWCWL